MPRRTLPCLVLTIPLAGCLPPPLGVDDTCEGDDECGSSSGSTSLADEQTPTTSGDADDSTGDEPDDGPSSTGDDADSGEPMTTDAPIEPPQIVDGVVIPDYIDDNGVLLVEASTAFADGARMLLDDGTLIELAPGRPGEFTGQIEAFTALDNGKHTAVLTPWRDDLVGAAVEVDYVIALPELAYEIGWQVDPHNGSVAAIAVLPDGRPVEIGTHQEMNSPRCYLQLRDRQGKSIESVPLLGSGHCRAIDLKIDRESGRMHVLVERLQGDETVWWAGEISSWGKGAKSIGTGVVGDTALALAARPDVVAVCGSRAVDSMDKLDALAILLRPNKAPETRTFDYQATNNPEKHLFTETARECAFAGDSLVLAGEADGKHDKGSEVRRNRLMVIEVDVHSPAADPVWTVAGIERGVQTRALALDLDDQGRFLLVGDRCLDACEPDMALWIYGPGGKFIDDNVLGPLGSSWFGPHDIAWSPAGYSVIALGAMQGQSLVFKVQAFAPGVPAPLWTFLPNDKQGLQIALAVAVGPLGEVYAGGIAEGDHPAFARIGG